MRTFLATLAFAGLGFYATSSSFAAPAYPATNGFGVPFAKDEAWYQQCMRVEHRSAPVPAARRDACDASELYYQKRGQAVTTNAEWNKVRQCALAHGDHAVLMMLYANGFGVPRDLDIAMHYACSLDFVAKAEMEGRVAHLAKLQPGAVFDQCDDITSGAMGGRCAEIGESQALRVRQARLDRMARALPASLQPSFKKLRAAADAYASAAMAEVDMQGTGAVEEEIRHAGKLREQFMQAALEVQGNQLAPASSSDVTQRDQELNAVYEKLMKAPSRQQDWPNRIGQSTVDRTEVRKVERLWLAYRDAFTAFETKLRPGASPDAIKALLTAQRSAELEFIARYDL